MHGGGHRIALIGTINRDTIFYPDGKKTESYGGLLYSILSLAEMVPRGTEIYPICNVGSDMEGVVKERLSPYPSVKLDGVQFCREMNPHCILVYDEDGRKQETLNGVLPPLEFDRLQPFLDCNAICFNFITGMELALETLQAVRKATRTLVCMDVHSLTLGIDDQRRRFWRIPPQWESWVGCADVVQLNEQEGALLANEPLENDESTERFADQVFDAGVSTLIITRSKRGSQTLSRSSTGKVEILNSPASLYSTPQDETGCGDVFLMGFTLSYLISGDLELASRFANRVAGIHVCFRGIDQINQIGRQLGPEEQFFPTVSRIPS